MLDVLSYQRREAVSRRVTDEADPAAELLV